MTGQAAPAPSRIAAICNLYEYGLAATLAAAGCAQFDQAFVPPPSVLSTPIPASELDWSRKRGANTVSGVASLKAGGDTRTCAGQGANLVPDSAYARTRMSAIFGNDSQGRRAASLAPVKFERDDPLYVSTLRRTTCDASGSFSFPARARRRLVRHDEREVGRHHGVEGASMMKRVDVRGGRLVKVTLP